MITIEKHEQTARQNKKQTLAKSLHRVVLPMPTYLFKLLSAERIDVQTLGVLRVPAYDYLYPILMTPFSGDSEKEHPPHHYPNALDVYGKKQLIEHLNRHRTFVVGKLSQYCLQKMYEMVWTLKEHLTQVTDKALLHQTFAQRGVILDEDIASDTVYKGYQRYKDTRTDLAQYATHAPLQKKGIKRTLHQQDIKNTKKVSAKYEYSAKLCPVNYSYFAQLFATNLLHVDTPPPPQNNAVPPTIHATEGGTATNLALRSAIATFLTAQVAHIRQSAPFLYEGRGDTDARMVCAILHYQFGWTIGAIAQYQKKAPSTVFKKITRFRKALLDFRRRHGYYPSVLPLPEKWAS